MQQTSLNLIAIGIFSITLCTLLGPLLHISPTVPAIATFGILGLATLDTLTWQGKGANLLLDSLAGTSAGYRDRIIRHEAGHFLVASLLDIPVTSYVLSAWEAFKQGKPGQGGVTFKDIESNSLTPLLIQRYCILWMAGIAAETLVYGNAEGGTEDRDKLRGVLSSLGRSQTECLQQERFCILQAQTLIKENLAAYEALVTAMEQRLSVSECDRTIKEHQAPIKVD